MLASLLSVVPGVCLALNFKVGRESPLTTSVYRYETTSTIAKARNKRMPIVFAEDSSFAFYNCISAFLQVLAGIITVMYLAIQRERPP